MQDKVFEVFRRLFMSRDPELMKLLNGGRDPFVSALNKQFANSRSSSFPAGTIGLVVPNPLIQNSKQSAIEQLQELMDENADKGEILQRLNKHYGWQGIAQMFLLLVKQVGIESLSTKGYDDFLEMFAQQPQYRIEIRENPDIKSGVGGVCQVVMVDKTNNEETEIVFSSSLHKAIYIWMLLHPRQAISRAQINKGLKHQIIGNNGQSISFYEMLYGVESKDLTEKEFPQVFSHIGRAVRTAWSSLGSKGAFIWYIIEGGDNKKIDKSKKTNLEITLYYINLPSNHISVVHHPCRSYSISIGDTREDDFRMPSGTYPSI